MVTVSQVKEWNADRLGRIADELHTRRSALTDLADEVTAGRPPASWVGGASVYAEQDHDQLAHRLTDQVAELNLVISALDTASSAVRGARTLLDDALARASSNGCTVSDDGRVESTRSYDDEDELADAQRVVDEIAQAVSDALSRAVDADLELAAALWSASGSDVDASGGLGDQTLPDALRGLSTEEQVAYLLDHPDLADVLIPSLPSALEDELGHRLSDLVDHEVNHEDGALEGDTAERLATLLDAYGSDSGIASAMFEDLGADGTVASLASIDSNLYVGGDDRLRGLAEDLRRTLGTASQDPQFDSRRFGEDLSRYATWSLDDDRRDAYEDRYPNLAGPNGASILTYLMGNRHLDGDLVEGVAVGLDDFERGAGQDVARSWYGHTGHSPLTADDAFDGWYDDPMAAALGNLGSHPENAYAFLTDDPERQGYYFRERGWEADGFEGVTSLMEAVGTDDGLRQDHAEGQAGLVSSFLHGMVENDSFSIDNAAAGSPHLAELLKHHTPSVDNALLYPSSSHDPGVHDFEAAGLGELTDRPRILTGDLDELMQVAVSTEDGATSIAEGIGGYQQTQINSLAQQLAADPGNDDLETRLRGVLENSSALRGFAEVSVGEVEIADAEEKDARVQAFSDLIGAAAGMVPLPGSGLAGEALSTVWEQGVDLGTGALTDAYGSNAEAATATAESRAEVGSTYVKIDAFLALAEAGVIPESEIDERWFDESGGLISRSDIAPEDLGSYGSDAIGNMGSIATDHDISEAFKDVFLEYYGEG
jgi:hypothetical protein